MGKDTKQKVHGPRHFQLGIYLLKVSLFLLDVNGRLPVCIYMYHKYALSTEARSGAGAPESGIIGGCEPL